jgi:pyridoxal phosphate enzyme (YggS family)
MTMMTNIIDNLAEIERQISHACQQAKRERKCVALLAVSKTKPIEMIEEAYQAGQRDFGENYIQEGIEKVSALAKLTGINWHFIGPIQSNKTQQIASKFSWVHSVDRIKIAKRLNEHRSSQDTPLNVCLQVNISGETSKSGVTIDELPALVEYVQSCDNLQLRGIMAIPAKDAEQASYLTMHHLFTKLQAQYAEVDTLSMGMSNDLPQAINAGSTMVRIGSAIFGARN